MLPVKADLGMLLVCLGSARVWLSCQAIKWISVLALLCWVFTYISDTFLLYCIGIYVPLQFIILYSVSLLFAIKILQLL